MEYQHTPEPTATQEQGSLGKGFLGALLGMLLGVIISGVFYIVFDESNTLLGFLLGFLIVKGFQLLKGRKCTAMLVVCIVCVVLGVVLAEGIYYVGLLEEAYKTVSYADRLDFYQFFIADPEFQEAFVKDLGTSFGYVGVPALASMLIFYFLSGKKEASAAINAPVADAAVPAGDDNSTDDASFN